LHDPRFAAFESAVGLERCAVLVAPLCERDAVHGVVYFDAPAPIDDQARDWVVQLVQVVAPLLRRAIDEDALRRRAQSLESDLLVKFDFAGIVTRDPQMLALLR